MNVYFYRFSKRNKSTKRPSGSYENIYVYLKEDTLVTAPTLLIDTFDAAAYNYCFIPKWNRYYFIADAKTVNNMWEVQLREDYLATFKDEIGATSCNILYAAGSTKNIVDARIPVAANVLRGHEYTAIKDIVITNGLNAIILGITGKGSFGCYLLKNSADLPELLDGVDNWQTQFITSPLEAIKQALYGGSAAECLKSAISLPIIVDQTKVSTGSDENLYLGNYPCKNSADNNIKGYRITQPLIISTTEITIPWQSSDWRKTAAYTTVSLYLPFAGLINIPATDVLNDSKLKVRYSINVTSGDISMEVFGATSEKKVAVASGNCALNTPFGSTGVDTTKMTSAIVTGVGTVAGAIGAAFTGGLSLAAAGAIGAGIAATAHQTFDALGGNGAGSGGLGGGASQGLDKVIHCFVTQKVLTDNQSNFDTIMGKPYMGVSKPNNFSGYVQTDGFQFASDGAYSSERDQVNALMDSGIYFE